MRVRAGLVSVIYNKSLVLSNDERTRASGDIVNLMSVDATRLQDFCTYALIAISGPFQVCRIGLWDLTSHLIPTFSDHLGFRFFVQSLGMGCVRRCSYHGHLGSSEHMCVLF